MVRSRAITSAYFIGGGVIYTHKARAALLGVRLADHPGMRASTEPYALLCAGMWRFAGAALALLEETLRSS